MDTSSVTLDAVIKADRTLELADPIGLPPGRVQVTIVATPETSTHDAFMKTMQAIWDSQRARGHVPRSVEEVQEERQRVRDEWEERSQRLERIQDDAEQLRQRQNHDRPHGCE